MVVVKEGQIDVDQGAMHRPQGKNGTKKVQKIQNEGNGISKKIEYRCCQLTDNAFFSVWLAMTSTNTLNR
jgi:hypothetical protein